MNEPKNHGVLRGPLAGNWVGGTIPWINRNPSGNWYRSTVVGEKQYFSNFDTMSCVSFAADNVCEIQIKDQTGIERNFSDRFLARGSNTTQQGNYVSTVLDALRFLGNVDEAVWPKPAEPTTWDAYMATIEPQIFPQAAKFKTLYDLQYEYIADMSPANVQHQLQHAPLMITIPGHEITALSLNNGILTILDDYIFNVDPLQPFIRQIKLSDVTDIFKAVLTVKGIQMNLMNDNGTYFLVGEKGKLGIADPESLKLLKQLTDAEITGSSLSPQVGIIEKGFVIHK